MPKITNSSSTGSAPLSPTPAPTPNPAPGPPPAPITASARVAYVIGTVAGLGYVGPAPGTWGSLVGVILYALIAKTAGVWYYPRRLPTVTAVAAIAITILISLLGTWAADRVEATSHKKDPQFVIVDEVSGQMLALSVAFAPLNWKYLVLGFILFRVFDISKLFPARQAENFRGGWGIMADDWVAALYAALLLWLARVLGL